MIKKNPQIDVIDKESENLEKFFPGEKQPKKKRKSGGGLLLRILLFYFPLGLILYAISLPNFLCQANKAKESEPKQYVGSMNRAQQAYFAENGTFSNSIDALGLGIKTRTTNFSYSVSATETTVFSYGITNPYETVYFGPFHWNEKRQTTSFRGYVGAVFLVTNNHTKEISTASILCVTKSPTKTQPPNPILNNGNPTCANGTDPVTR